MPTNKLVQALISKAGDAAVDPENWSRVVEAVKKAGVGQKATVAWKFIHSNMHAPAIVSPSLRINRRIDAVEDILDNHSDDLPPTAAISKWRSSLSSLRMSLQLVDKAKGKDHGKRLKELEKKSRQLLDDVFASFTEEIYVGGGAEIMTATKQEQE